LSGGRTTIRIYVRVLPPPFVVRECGTQYAALFNRRRLWICRPVRAGR
jgi:hypothetical protein